MSEAAGEEVAGDGLPVLSWVDDLWAVRPCLTILAEEDDDCDTLSELFCRAIFSALFTFGTGTGSCEARKREDDLRAGGLELERAALGAFLEAPVEMCNPFDSLWGLAREKVTFTWEAIAEDFQILPIKSLCVVMAKIKP